jgi:Glycosyl transferase family 2.
MKHWQPYIERQKQEYTRITFPPEFNADLIVVIPCYNEPHLFETLRSLRACARPQAHVLVAVIFNSSERSDGNAVIQNRISFEQTRLFAENYLESGFCFYPLLFEGLPGKHAGVGLARKIGMDLAVEHFLRNENARGVIVSLDADCTVSENFPASIYNAFRQDEHLNATIHNFYHRPENDDTAMENAARQYEAYIRYFRDMMKFAGFPYHYHTIGSAFAVSADAYVRAGGMGRQQGGEDFYFLQKVFALGNVAELTDVYVFPMARFSDRVPFGTGPTLQKIMDEPDGMLKVYSPNSFRELKRLFDRKDTFFKKSAGEILSGLEGLHPSLTQFLQDNDFIGEVADCNKNSAALATFRKRFFHHFNAFRIIKYLNYVHPDPFPFEKISSVTDNF